jgi:cytochrome c5
MKKLNLKNIVASISIMMVAFVLVSFEMGWVVPAADAAVKNPVKSTPASIAAGKALYVKDCKMCHGEKGVGVGKMAGTANFTLPEFKSQTDGAIYYKINTGFGKMPAYKTKIAADNDRWNLVNFLRTLN